MGGWDLFGEMPLKLWVESVYQSLTKAGAKVCGDVVRTFQSEEQFFAILVSSPQGNGACPEQGRREERAKTIPFADKAEQLFGALIRSYHRLVGGEPEQAADAAGTIPLRRIVIDDLMRNLEAKSYPLGISKLERGAYASTHTNDLAVSGRLHKEV